MRLAGWLVLFTLVLAPVTAGTDNEPPRTSLSISGPFQPEVVNGEYRAWIAGGTRIILEASDADSGVAATYYRMDDGDTATSIGPVMFGSPSGIRTLTFWSVDNAGNAETPRTARFHVDADAPEVAITSPRPHTTYLLDGTVTSDAEGTTIALTGAAPILLPIPIAATQDARPEIYGCAPVRADISDSGIGVKRAEVYVDGTWRGQDFAAPFEWYVCVGEGEHEIRVTGIDRLGNEASDVILVVGKRVVGAECDGEALGLVVMGACHRSPLTPLVPPDGCTPAGAAYACKHEEAPSDPGGCSGTTGIGAGVNGAAGVGLAGHGSCGGLALDATAFVSTLAVESGFDDRSTGCTMWASVGSISHAQRCPPGFFTTGQGPWGHMLP